jgi:Ran GTPase-activating protein (RanGAP) involved in mRNA processing and transport
MSAILSSIQDPTNKIRHINLANNFLDNECYRILGQILQTKSNLVSLNLSNNDILLVDAALLAAGLRANRGLERL